MTRDTYAEAVVAACAAASARGCALAHGRLTVDDFTRPGYAAVFTAAATTAAFPMPDGDQVTAWARARVLDEPTELIWPSERRVHAIAAAVDIHVDVLQELIDARPVDTDAAGVYARRVLDATARRHLESSVVALHELVRSGDERHAAELAVRIAATLGAAS